MNHSTKETVGQIGGRPWNWNSLSLRLNGEWHETALRWYVILVLGHWAEHLIQAFQIFVLKWPRAESLGLLGQFFPWIFKTEILHYAYALGMLIGLWIFRSGFKGRSAFWWQASLVLQFWHHFEHLLLQGQYLLEKNLFGAPVPMSILQLWVPRVELHLFYNTIVFIPMAIAMYYHLFPDQAEHEAHTCSCAWNSGQLA